AVLPAGAALLIERERFPARRASDLRAEENDRAGGPPIGPAAPDPRHADHQPTSRGRAREGPSGASPAPEGRSGPRLVAGPRRSHPPGAPGLRVVRHLPDRPEPALQRLQLERLGPAGELGGAWQLRRGLQLGRVPKIGRASCREREWSWEAR